MLMPKHFRITQALSWVCCAGKFLTNAIREADVDKDGRVSLEDFIKYYERLAR